MKLFAAFSEAIREGAKLRPQFFGYQGAANGSSCAILAGIEAITDSLASSGNYNEAIDPYPYLDTYENHLCPATYCEEYAGTLLAICWHLNDAHKWTREAIADWLETEEEKLGFVTLTENEREQPEYSLAQGVNHDPQRRTTLLTTL